MLHYKKGEYQVAVKPYLFNGDFSNPNQADGGTGKYDGWGGAATYSRGLADKWGWYVYSIYTRLYGGFKFGDGPGDPGTVFLDSNDTSFAMLSPGLVYEFFGDKENGFSLPVFLGPSVNRISSTQHVRQFNTRKDGGGAISDFEMDMESLSPGLFGGIQAGFNVNRHIQLNPYVIMAGFFGGDFDSRTLNTRFNNPPAAGSPSVMGTSPQSDNGAFITGGINLTYRPWGLSFNITSPFLKQGIKFGNDYSGSVSHYSVTWAFGNYRK